MNVFILGMDSAYDEAIEKRGRNMLISANLVSEMVDKIREDRESIALLAETLNSFAVELTDIKGEDWPERGSEQEDELIKSALLLIDKFHEGD